MEASLRPDFPDSLGKVRPELFKYPKLKTIYESQLEIPGFEDQFKGELDILWRKFVSDYDAHLDKDNDGFELDEWCYAAASEMTDKVHDNAIEAFENLCLDYLALFYLLCNIQEISPGIYTGIKQGDYMLDSAHEVETSLDKIMRLTAAVTEEIYDSYKNKIHDLDVESLKRRWAGIRDRKDWTN